MTDRSLSELLQQKKHIEEQIELAEKRVETERVQRALKELSDMDDQHRRAALGQIEQSMRAPTRAIEGAEQLGLIDALARFGRGRE